MDCHRDKRHCRGWLSIRALPLFAFLGLVSTSAQAGSVCVTCEQPTETYECRLPADADLKSASRAVRTGSKLLCMRAIAKAYGHTTCRVRKRAVGPCTGAVVDLAALAAPNQSASAPAPDDRSREITQPGGAIAPSLPATPRDQPEHPANSTPDPDKAQKQKPSDEAPKTVVELAKRTADATNKQLKETGDTVAATGKVVGDAVKKSWQCVTSLFSNC